MLPASRCRRAKSAEASAASAIVRRIATTCSAPWTPKYAERTWAASCSTASATCALIASSSVAAILFARGQRQEVEEVHRDAADDRRIEGIVLSRNDCDPENGVPKQPCLDDVRLSDAQLLVRGKEGRVSQKANLDRIVDRQLSLKYCADGGVDLCVLGTSLVPLHAVSGSLLHSRRDVPEGVPRIGRGAARHPANAEEEHQPSIHGDFGTRFIPHFGQRPGASDRTSGCMGHV
jgi:hypothetical protein